MPLRTFLGYDEHFLQDKGGLWTAREIAQQPQMLRKTHGLLVAQRDEIAAFLKPLLARKDIRVVLTGAGTSAFIGESLAPWLAAKLHRRVEAVATTDVISAPKLYLDADLPTLLVSFGRSGNSPESMAAISLVDRFVRETYHLIVTCNVEGALARHAAEKPHAFCIQLPDATHDRSFAMTSSYTCQAYAALAALSGVETMSPRIDDIADAAAGVIDDYTAKLKEMAAEEYERVVYLGSHLFKGVAREAALKLMELTNGAVTTLFDSPTGLRHGPKTFVNARTLAVVFLSNDPYTRQYDLDLLAELRRDGEAKRMIAVTAQDDPAIGDRIVVRGLSAAEDCDLLFPYIVGPQIFAFQRSLRQGLMPDNPNTKGTVNRVVKGVRIHEPV
jgi:tagatose-6-phosphate ketose/aldose isomerase